MSGSQPRAESERLREGMGLMVKGIAPSQSMVEELGFKRVCMVRLEGGGLRMSRTS